jgi:transposase-like protein
LAWRNAWTEFVPFLDYDVEIRKIICTTNAIESLNARYRRAVRARGHFPNDAAALKCLPGDRITRPHRTRSGTMGHPMEGSAQRLRHHLRGT